MLQHCIYDSFGRVIEEYNSNGMSREYTYDGNGNILSYTLKENDIVKTQNTYTYDAIKKF